MHIKNKFLLIVLFFQPFTLMSADFFSFLKETIATLDLDKDNKKNLILTSTLVLGAASLVYFGRKFQWDEKFKEIEYESKKIDLARAHNQFILELQKVQKETGEEAEGLDIDKITAEHLTGSWKRVDLQNKKRLYQLDKQIKQQVLEKLKKQNQEQADSDQVNTEKIPSFAGLPTK